MEFRANFKKKLDMDRLNEGKPATMLIAKGLQGEEDIVQNLKSRLIDDYSVEVNKTEKDTYDVIINNNLNNKSIKLEIETSTDNKWNENTTEKMLKLWPRGLSIPARKFLLLKNNKIYFDENGNVIIKSKIKFQLYIRQSNLGNHFAASTLGKIVKLIRDKKTNIKNDVPNNVDTISNTNCFIGIPKKILLNKRNFVVDDMDRLIKIIIEMLK